MTYFKTNDSFKVQCRVIGALLIREVLTRYGRHNVGFMWLFLEPMLFTIGVSALWSIFGSHRITNIPIAAFALTGYSSVLLWRNAVNRCNVAIQPNLCLMYHRNVRVIDVFFARLILETVGATASLLVLSIVFIVIGISPVPNDFLTLLLGWILLVWFAFGLGLCIGSLTEMSDFIERVWHVISYLFFGFSGAAFMVAWLPNKLKDLVGLIPVVNCTELIRKGFFGGDMIYYYDISYVVVFNTCLMFVGLLLVRHVGQQIEPE